MAKAKKQMYNVFDSETGRKVNFNPVNEVNAEFSKNFWEASHDSEAIIQPIFTPDRKGYEKYLDWRGWEDNGDDQYYEFRFAMEHDMLVGKSYWG